MFQEEINVAESYEEIAARVQAWEKKSDLDEIRAELALQVINISSVVCSQQKYGL